MGEFRLLSVVALVAGLGVSAASAATVAYPDGVWAKYARQTSGQARMHTCLDQYHADKKDGQNAGLRWIEKGGGYWSRCSRKLKGLKDASPVGPRGGAPGLASPKG